MMKQDYILRVIEEFGQAWALVVARLRAVTDKKVAVGIGVTTGAHARELAGFADGVIVGSAVVLAAQDGGPAAVKTLVAELAEGCRR